MAIEETVLKMMVTGLGVYGLGFMVTYPDTYYIRRFGYGAKSIYYQEIIAGVKRCRKKKTDQSFQSAVIKYELTEFPTFRSLYRKLVQKDPMPLLFPDKDYSEKLA